VIERIIGRAVKVDPTYVVVETGGVGFSLLVPLSTSSKLVQGEKSTLFTELIVREDSLTIFGFLTERERSLFNLLRSVAGVGPKLACTVLSGVTVEGVLEAVTRADTAMLARVPGIGKKTAGRIVMELSEKVEHVLAPSLGGIPSSSESIQALMSLGYHRSVATRAVEEAIEAAGADAPVEQIIREALSRLSGHRAKKAES
jgi:Holliday junction DNA helicase RuvA